MLTFDAETHTYTLDGRRIPGITEILRTADLIDTAHFNESARERGTRVHEAIHADIEGKLDEEHPDTVAWKAAAPGEWGMVQAARRAINELELRPLAAEALVANPTYGYATHIDLIALRGDRVAVVNWKSSATPYPWEAIQSAGEAMAVTVEMERFVKIVTPAAPLPVRYSIHLRGDGTYRIEQWRRLIDFDVFRAALTIWAWKQQYSGGTP